MADTLNTQIRKVTPAGVVTTFTGQGTTGYLDGSATNALFGYLKNVSLDVKNNIYVIDTGNNVIRKLTNFLGIANNVQTILALTLGNKAASYNSYKYPASEAIGSDASGNVYVVDYANSLIQKIGTNGMITTIAGRAGTSAFATGIPLPGTLLQPTSIYVDPAGAYLYVLENNSIVNIKLTSN